MMNRTWCFAYFGILRSGIFCRFRHSILEILKVLFWSTEANSLYFDSKRSIAAKMSCEEVGYRIGPLVFSNRWGRLEA